VNTGLSEDAVSKCLTETIYCSSDQCQDEGSCVICLVCFGFGSSPLVFHTFIIDF
jgi:hypothetical protein